MKIDEADDEFSDILLQLEDIVSRLESSESTVESSLVDFEQGIKLLRKSQHFLAKAQQQVDLLIDERDGFTRVELKDEGGAS